MKQTLIMLSLSMVFASCGTGGSDQTAALQKKLDSLTSILNSGSSGERRIALTGAMIEGPRMIGEEPKESYYLSYLNAHQYIDKWKQHVRNANNGLIEDTGRFSFIIPSSNLRYLIDADSMNLDYVTFYLALDSSNLITLIYQGGNIQTDSTGNRVLVEQPVHRKNGVNYTFDHAYPCPYCDIVGFKN